MSTPVPVVMFTLTDLGFTTGIDPVYRLKSWRGVRHGRHSQCEKRCRLGGKGRFHLSTSRGSLPPDSHRPSTDPLLDSLGRDHSLLASQHAMTIINPGTAMPSSQKG